MKQEAIAIQKSFQVPLTKTQQGMWFLQALAKDECFYNICWVFKLSGLVESKILNQALNNIISRNDSFRTVFQQKNNNVFQFVLQKQDINLITHSLKYLSKTEQLARLKEAVYTQTHTPFDLEQGPLLRAHLYVADANKSYLVISMHHLIFDGWSVGLLLKEISEQYVSVQQEPHKIIRTEFGYSKFAIEQQQNEKDPNLALQKENDLTFWRERYKKPPSAIKFTQKLNADHQSKQGGRVYFKLPASLVAQLKQAIKSQRVTLFMYLLAAYKVLLYRYSGDHDLSVGIPVANRQNKEYWNIIGYFVNTIPVRTRIEDAQSFSQFLQAEKNELIQCMQHMNVPLDEIVRSLDHDRSSIDHHSPLFNTAFVVQNGNKTMQQMAGQQIAGQKLSEQQLSGHQSSAQQFAVSSNTNVSDHISLDHINLDYPDDEDFRWSRNDTGWSEFDITLEIIDNSADGCITGTFEYKTALFTEQFMSQMSENFKQLLDQLSLYPDEQVSRLDYLSAEYKQQLLNKDNYSQQNYTTANQYCLHQRFEEQALTYPDHPALIIHHNDNNQAFLTYKELNEQANQLAHWLIQHAINVEQSIAVCLPQSIERIVSILAILKSGAVYVPIDPDYPENRIQHIIADSQAQFLITHKPIANKLTKVLDDDNSIPFLVLDKEQENIDSQPKTSPTSSVSPNNLAYIIYTSGSTGVPKGVQIEHRSVNNLVLWHQKEFKVRVTSRATQFASISFDAAVWEIWPYLCSGASLYLLAKETTINPQATFDYLNKHSITHSFLPTPIAELLINFDWPESTALNYLLTGGDRLSAVDLNDMPFKLVNNYGPTEGTVVATSTILDNKNYQQSPSIGKSITNVSTFVVDNNNQLVPFGVAGELCIGGLGVSRGYLNRTELNQKQFIKNPLNQALCYKTGDIVRLDQDGHIEFMGRKDKQIKIRGYRIEPGEIEAKIKQFKVISEVYVMVNESPEHKVSHNVLTAYITLNENDTVNHNSLIQSVKESLSKDLPVWMIPERIEVLSSLPLTPNGKIDEQVLSRVYETKPKSTLVKQHISPNTPLTKRIALIWGKLLAYKDPGIKDNFFEVGGHSLLTVELINIINKELNTAITVNQFFVEPTIRGIARLIKETNYIDKQNNTPELPLINLEKEISGYQFLPQVLPEKRSNENPEYILLTGATGFVGAYLLSELLKQSDAKIICLLRDKIDDDKSGKKVHKDQKKPSTRKRLNRIKSTLTHYQLFDEKQFHRIIPIKSNLSMDKLGLTDRLFHKLSEKVDQIIHNGAYVHHVMPYEQLKKANVDSTAALIRLAATHKLKPICLMSTPSVFHHSTISSINENTPIKNEQLYQSEGYMGSKWVSENLMLMANKAGIPAMIYRLGRMTGDSQTGISNKSDYLSRLLISCVKLGYYCDDLPLTDITPVDRAVTALVKSYQLFAKNQLNDHKVIHVFNSDAMVSPTYLLEQYGKNNKPLIKTSMQDIYQRIKTKYEQGEVLPIVPYLPLFETLLQSTLNKSDAKHHTLVESQHSMSLFKDLGVDFEVDSTLIQKYFSYLLKE